MLEKEGMELSLGEAYSFLSQHLPIFKALHFGGGISSLK